MATAEPEGIQGRRVRNGKGFESLRRETLQDERISFKALGILTYLLSLPDNWRTTAERLGKLRPGKEAHYAIRTGLRELEQAGYLRRERKTGPGGKLQWTWLYTDDPATMVRFPADGSDLQEQGVSAGRTMERLSTDGQPSDIEIRDCRGSKGDEDQNLERSADAPSPQASTVDVDPWLTAFPASSEPLPPPSYTDSKEWLEYKANGFEAGEEPLVDDMLNRGEEPKKILNKILKDRSGIAAGATGAVRGDWLPYVRRKIGGKWGPGERDYARKLLADWHPDIVVEELRCLREQQAA